MQHFIEKTERVILWTLAFLLLACVTLGTVALFVDFLRVLLLPPVLMIKPDTLFHMFGDFLIVLIGLKLIKLVLVSLPGESSPIPVVIEVALIGLGQKVVTMDVKTQSPGSLVGVAALILSLAVAYVACQPRRPRASHIPPEAGDEPL